MKKLFLGAFAFCAAAIVALLYIPNSTFNAGNDIPRSVFSAGNAQADGMASVAASPAVKDAGPSYANTFLWKVEKSGLPTSYLLGTLHLGRENEGLAGPIVNAFDKSITLVTEANVMPEGEELFGLSMMMLDMQGSLSQTLGQARFDQLSEAVKSVVPASALEKMKPWSALTLIAYNKPEGYSEQFGIDMLLTKKAIEQKKRRIFLEELQESIKVFADLPQDKVISYMNVLLDNADDAKRETEKMIELYRGNRVNELVNMLKDKEQSLKYFPQEQRSFWEQWMDNQLLGDRNARWIPILTRQLESESSLVAVGALHLFGEGGMIEQLQLRGYTVTPIM